MTNKEIESYRNSYKVVNGIGFCRVNNDINGNPRYVVHFLAFATDEEMRNDNLSQNQLYAIAKKRANDLGFSVYRANYIVFKAKARKFIDLLGMPYGQMWANEYELRAAKYFDFLLN